MEPKTTSDDSVNEEANHVLNAQEIRKNNTEHDLILFESEPKDLKLQKELFPSPFSEAPKHLAVICEKDSQIKLIFPYFKRNSSDIIFYGLDNEEVITKIIDAHEGQVTHLKYFQKPMTKTPYLLTSAEDDYIKLFDIDIKYECILRLYGGSECLHPLSMVFDSQTYFIITALRTTKYVVNVINSSGERIEPIFGADENIYCDTYYWNNKAFVLLAHHTGLKVIEFKTQKAKYFAGPNKKRKHYYAFMQFLGGKLSIIEIEQMNKIKIWDYESETLKYQFMEKEEMNICCLWSERYLLLGGSSLRILDMTTNTTTKLEADITMITDMRKIYSETYGECLITSDIKKGLRLYAFDN